MQALWCFAAVALGGAALAPAPKAHVAPVKVHPVAYFEAHCARCHGPGGMFYGSEFGKNMTSAQLQSKVKAMADGPGDAPLKGADLSALVAYHRALIAKGPFVAWVGQAGATLSLEATAGAKLSSKVGGKARAMALRKGLWTLELKPREKPEDVVVAAKKDKATSTLALMKSATTH